MAAGADLAAVKVLCKNLKPTRESINQDLGPFLEDLKSSPRFGTSLLSKLARRKSLGHFRGNQVHSWTAPFPGILFPFLFVVTCLMSC